MLDIDKGFYMPGWGSLPGRLRRWPLLIDRGGSPLSLKGRALFFGWGDGAPPTVCTSTSCTDMVSTFLASNFLPTKERERERAEVGS